MNTNDIPIIQQILASQGYHLNGYEITLLLALPHTVVGAVTHYWQKVRGWEGICLFFKTGSTTQPTAAKP